MGLDIGLGDNRWQGYSHEELYAMLHAGPGPAAAGVTADRWSAMAGALSDIQQDISSGVATSGASWIGDAGDVARAALNPLGDWAQQASAAADVMRVSTELQGDLLGKARAEMPAPVPIPQQTSQVSQLVTAQVDYEVAEAASQVAAQQAFQVMAQYEAGTTDNTSTLGEFDQPPTLHVDTTPITGVAVRGRIGGTGSERRISRTPSSSVEEPPISRTPVGPSRTTNASTAPTEEPTPPPPASGASDPVSTSTTPAAPSESPTPTPVGATTDSGSGTGPAPSSGSALGSDPVSGSSPTSTAPSSAARTPTATTPSSAAPTETPPISGNPLPTQAAASNTRDRDNNGATSSPAPRATTGTFVPAARRANRDDEPDEEHESKYLILADDIYGDQAYSPPVIGENRPVVGERRPHR